MCLPPACGATPLKPEGTRYRERGAESGSLGQTTQRRAQRPGHLGEERVERAESENYKAISADGQPAQPESQ
jgi:hypothetical protein